MEIRKIKEIPPPQVFNLLIYGQPGIGKTSLALTSKNALVFDLDKGVHRSIFTDADAVTDLQDANIEDLSKLITSGAIAQYDTVIIDTVGKLIDMIITFVQKKFNRPTLRIQDWGAVKAEFINFTRLVNSLGKSIIYVAHEQEVQTEVDGVTKMIKRPDLGAGSGGKNLIRDLDAIGYYSVVGKSRVLDFRSNESFYSKDGYGIGTITAASKLEPLTVHNAITEAMFHKFSDNYTEQIKIADTVRSLESEINTAVDAIELNMSIDAVNLSGLPDSNKKALKAMIVAKSKELGLVFDRSKNAFARPIEDEVGVA